MGVSYPAHSTCHVGLGYTDPGRYRATPAGEPSVPELVQPGRQITTSYRTGGTVVKVAGPVIFTTKDGRSFEHFTIVYVPSERYGRHTPQDHRWINDLVAVGGRLLMLFELNQDEVFVEAGPPQFAENRRGQLSMF